MALLAPGLKLIYFVSEKEKHGREIKRQQNHLIEEKDLLRVENSMCMFIRAD